MIKDKKDLKINALENSNNFNLYICIEEQDTTNSRGLVEEEGMGGSSLDL